MPRRLYKDRLIDDVVGCRKPSFNIADLPLIGHLTIGRQGAAVDLGPIHVGPRHVFQFPTVQCVPFETRVRPTRSQTVERVERKRQRFKIDLHLLNRISCCFLGHRRNRQNWLPLIQRLVGQHLLTRRLDRRQIVRREDRLHTRHRQCCPRIHIQDPSMRHRT